MGRLTQIMRAIDGLEFVEHIFKHDEELFHDSILVKLEPDLLWHSEFSWLENILILFPPNACRQRGI